MTISPDRYQKMKPSIESILDNTDHSVWYWRSILDGSKFAIVTAELVDCYDTLPEAGTELKLNSGKLISLDKNSVEMKIVDVIAVIHNPNGAAMCEFIAMAHDALVVCSSLPKK